MSSWTESEWDDDQRELIAAEQIVRANTGTNGEWLPDAMSDAADPMAYSGFRYAGEGPFTNWYEKAKLDRMDEYKKQAGEKVNMNGVYFTAKEVRFSAD